MSEQIEQKIINGETLEELVSKRSYTWKAFKGPEFETNRRSIKYHFHTAHQHYKDIDQKMKEIDTTMSFDGADYVQSKASFHSRIPEFADGWIAFRNVYKEADETVRARPVCGHVKGVLVNDPGEGNHVFYKDAFQSGVDLKIYAYHHGLKEVAIINSHPGGDFSIEFELDLGGNSLKKGPIAWDKASRLDFTGKNVLVGASSYFRNALVWDSGKTVQPVEIEVNVKGAALYLKKIIRKEFFDKAVFPVMTDHATNFFSGSGDGDIFGSSAVWDTIHDSSTGSVEVTQTSAVVDSHLFGGNYVIERGYVPIDTSALEDEGVVKTAILYLKGSAVILHNDGGGAQDYSVIVQSSQADPTTLASEDFDQCGSVNNPTEGSARFLTANWNDTAYNIFRLNDTGRSWVSKTGYTTLGVRYGYDAEDVAPPSAGQRYISFATSEVSGTTSDPYLEVVISSGAVFVNKLRPRIFAPGIAR